MKVKNNVFLNYKDKFYKKELNFIQLNNESGELERLFQLIIQIDSEFLFPLDQEEKLKTYCKKLIDNAHNFILSDSECDIGILSIYANDHKNKMAFTSTIGILPSFRGGSIGVSLVKFAIEFAKEEGMEFYKAEVSKKNAKWLAFLQRYKFEIESETENDSYIIVRKL